MRDSIADPQHPSLDFEVGSSLEQIQVASVCYRIAIGPQAGRKAVTLYSVPPLDEEPHVPLLALMYGFSLHAGTVCEVYQRSKLERLCRDIPRQLAGNVLKCGCLNFSSFPGLQMRPHPSSRL